MGVCNHLLPYYQTPKEAQIYSNFFKVVAPNKLSSIDQTMESVIHDFKMHSEGYHISKHRTYVAIESPKGEYGVTLVSNNTNRPYRLKLRAPGFHHLQALNPIATTDILSNLLTVLGSLDIVMGEVDK